MRPVQKKLPIPAWVEDELDSPYPPATRAPYFDDALDAWVLTRHDDVLAAFRTSNLFPIGPNHDPNAGPPSESERMAMRADTMAALSPTQLCAWQKALVPEVQAMADALPVGQPVDLLSAYAQPLCLSFAAMVTGLSRQQAAQLQESAGQVSEAAAEPFDPVLRTRAKAASSEMCRSFHSGPETLRESGFVAISQTLPCLLGNAWFALIQAPEQWRRLHNDLALIDQAIEELLRHAGLARTLTRQAETDIDLNGALICRGQRLILRIVAANHDPERFPSPDRVDVTRRGGGHFTLGAGSHACVAAGLIRIAASMFTMPLVQRFSGASLLPPVDWKGGSGFRSPAALKACLTV
jgi:cytochrome P450